MTELELTWELPTAGLLGLAAAAVAVLLGLIIGARVHAFLALVLVSALTALAAGVPFEAVVPTMLSGFGGTLAAVALLVGLGAMLGRMLELSGGAQVLTDALVQRFGEDRAPLALGIASLLMGFPIFFDAGLVVMLPIIFAVARRLGGSVLTYAFPAAVAFSVMHIFVPPHPGPVAASGLLGADVGLVVLLGLLIAIPAWVLVGRVFGGWVGRTYDLPVPEILRSTDHDDDAASFRSDPTVRTTLSLLALPLVLIFLNTGLNALATAEVVSLEDGWVRGLRLLGETPVALLITVFVAMYVLAWRHGRDRGLVDRVVDGALGPICAIVLITGAGFQFGVGHRGHTRPQVGQGHVTGVHQVVHRGRAHFLTILHGRHTNFGGQLAPFLVHRRQRLDEFLQLLVFRVFLAEQMHLLGEAFQGFALGHQNLAAQQIQRLNTGGAFIDHADTGITNVLLHTPLGDKPVTTEYLHTQVGCFVTDLGQERLGDRGEEA